MSLDKKIINLAGISLLGSTLICCGFGIYNLANVMAPVYANQEVAPRDSERLLKQQPYLTLGAFAGIGLSYLLGRRLRNQSNQGTSQNRKNSIYLSSSVENLPNFSNN